MATYARLEGQPLPRLPLWKSVAGVFLPSFFGFVALDLVWITVVARGLYEGAIGEGGSAILRADPDPLAAALAWLAIVGMNQVFVLPTTVGSRSLGFTALKGAQLGLLLYASVDLTNCSLLRGWNWQVSLIDMAWGTAGGALVALLQGWLHAFWAGPGPAVPGPAAQQ